MGLPIRDAYERHAEELVRFATGVVGPDDAADVVAEAFAKAAGSRAWSRVREPRPYLYRMVLNECRMLQRSASRRRHREAQSAVRIGHDDPVPQPDVESGLDVLSPQQRAVVVLTYWEDLTSQQVASRLGIREGSVKRHLARARSKLREVLDDY